jgi:hypothetical protein
MTITKEIKESMDKYGHIVDFVFSFRYVTFIDISEYKIGDDIKCPECHRDDYLVANADNPTGCSLIGTYAL